MHRLHVVGVAPVWSSDCDVLDVLTRTSARDTFELLQQFLQQATQQTQKANAPTAMTT